MRVTTTEPRTSPVAWRVLSRAAVTLYMVALAAVVYAAATLVDLRPLAIGACALGLLCHIAGSVALYRARRAESRG